MARKDKGQRPNADNVNWGGFLDIRLTEDQKAAFHLWHRERGEDIWTEFAEIVATGLKFGLSYDAAGDFYTATFTGFGEQVIGLRDRYCMTARAPQWPTALALLVYKHLVIAEGDWGNYRPTTGRMDNFG